MLRQSRTGAEIQDVEFDIIEHTSYGEPLPPLLGSSDAEIIGPNPDLLTHNTSINLKMQSTVTLNESFNNNNNRDVVDGLLYKTTSREFDQNVENTMTLASRKQLFDSSMATNSQIFDRSSFSQPNSPRVIRHRFLRESQNRMSDAEVVKERRKKLITMRESYASGRSMAESSDNVTGNRISPRKRHSSSNAVIYKHFEYGDKELAFGPVWLDGNSSNTDKSTTGTRLRDSLEIRPNKKKEFELLPRNTIAGFCYQEEKSGSKVENTSNRRRTIAPIGSLDDKIRQRKGQRQVRSRTLPEGEIKKELKPSPILSRAATLPEDISEEPNDYSQQSPPSPRSHFSNLIQEESIRQSGSLPDLLRSISPDIHDHSQSASVADMKASFRRMRSRLNPTQQILPTSPMKQPRHSMTLGLNISPRDIEKSSDGISVQTLTEPRRRTGSFGSRILRRAKSAVSKQSKKVNANNEEEEDQSGEKYRVDSSRSNRGMLQKQTSLNENLINRVSVSPNDYSFMVQNTANGTFHDRSSLQDDTVSTISSSPCHNILMHGDLYRRKRLVWNKTWGVLTADRILTLYKSKELFELTRKEWTSHSYQDGDQFANKTRTLGSFGSTNSLSGILSIVNLKSGCEIENVEQKKKSTTFQLIPHSYQTFTQQGGTATLPIDSDWGVPHKPIHLMCKNNDEFLYWVKAFVQLNTEERVGRKSEARNLVLSSNTSTPTSRRLNSKYSQETKSKTGCLVIDMEGEKSPYMNHVSVRNDTRIGSPHSRKTRDCVVEQRTPRKISNVDLNEIKFIDDDEENSTPEIRRTSDFEDKITYCENSLKTQDCEINELVLENHISRDSKLDTQIPEIRDMKYNQNMLQIPNNHPGVDHDFGELGLKRCSKTEKLNTRKARIVSGKSTHDDPHITHVSDSKNTEVRRKTKSNSTIKTTVGVSNIDMIHGSPSKTTNERELSLKTNKESYSRDKTNGEKRSTKKGNLIDERSSRDVQTIQSIQSDKRRDYSSSVVPVYSGDLVEKENITRGVESAKDKHYKSNENSSTECENFVKSPSSVDIEIVIEGEKVVEDISKAHTNNNSTSIQPVLSSHDRLSIKHFKSRSGIGKQKSLRQKVLRKLGPTFSLSNSSPDINSAVENEIDDDDILDIHFDEEATSSAPTIKLRRNTAFRGDRERSSRTLTRCLSDTDLLDVVEDVVEDEIDGKDMRTFKNVRKLSQDTFMETYGVVSRKKTGKVSDKHKRHTTHDINKNDLPGFAFYVDENDYIDNNTNERRSSTSESSSGESSSYQSSLTNSEPTTVPLRDALKVPLSKSKSDDVQVVVKRPKSTGSEGSDRHSGGKESSRSSWIASLTPHFARKANKEPSPTMPKTSQTARRAVFKIPASNLTGAAHRGYLDRRNKKKQWDRFWCVLQDSCLYCYNSPQSEYTQDATVLRGYDVIADVTNMNRSRFPFRLERQGSPTLHFSSENHRDFLLWVGTLEKETSNVLAATTDRAVLANSVKTTAYISKHDNQQTELENGNANQIDDVKTVEPYGLQKENLLREVLAHQHKIIEEEKLLHEKNANVKLSVMSDYTTRRVSKDQVNEKYSRVKEDEEMKMLKCLTHLNKRRNSAQLKVDQITKQLAPKSGRKRRENPHQFADMEAKLKELQERLAIVDQEIHDKHTVRQDVFEKIKQRRDLELLILEQQESLAIIHKHQATLKRKAFAQQTQSEEGSERLTSIDEMSTISDCSTASSNSFPDPLSLSVDSRLQNMSTPRQKRADRTNNNVVSEDDSGFHRSDVESTVLSQGEKSIDDALSRNFRSMSTSSEESEKSPVRRGHASTTDIASANEDLAPKKNEVDPSVLAYIEDFQLFSKQKLAKNNSN